MSVVTYIVNRDGTSVLIGAGDYVNCAVKKAELSQDWQGKEQYKLTINSDVILPVYLGARVFAQEENGAGGYVLLSPPSVERLAVKLFVYEYIFSGFVHHLETVILFNQDAAGYGWEGEFSLVGDAQDFIDLIIRNMNRTQPTDSNLEKWQSGTVDSTTETLLSFDNDNCLTALKKVSESFGLPYFVTGAGGFHEYWVNISLTANKRRHTHVYDIGNGLSSIKTVGDSERKFATAICGIGGVKNIPYDYRGGLKRLHCGIGTTHTETVYDENAEWTPALTVDPGVSFNPYSTDNPKVGTHCLRCYGLRHWDISLGYIYSIRGTKFTFTAPAAVNVDGSTLKFWLSGGENYNPVNNNYFTVKMYSGSTFVGAKTFYQNSWGFGQLVTEDWIEISISMAAFHVNYSLIDKVEFEIGTWSDWNDSSEIKIDNLRFDWGLESELENFIYEGTTISDHGRIELPLINEDIYPELNCEITSVEDDCIFIGTSIPFDLNEVDGEGNTVYLVPELTPQINFLSGNLSGYSFGLKSFNYASKRFNIAPITEDTGNIVPSESGAYSLQAGDRFNITNINLPSAYIVDAETRLYAWALEQYEKYSAMNEIADVEIDHVWLTDTGNLYYEDTASPGTYNLMLKTNKLYQAGDLIRITVPGFYDRELLIQSVTQERSGSITTYKVTLANNEPMNIAGTLISGMKGLDTKIKRSQVALLKYLQK